MRVLKTSLLAFSFLTLPVKKIIAASCCGGSSVAPLIMSKEADNTVFFSLSKDSLTHSADIKGRVNPFSSSLNSVIDQANLGLIHNVSSYIQIGGSVSFFKKYAITDSQKESSSGLRDVSLQLNYEFLPEFYYSRWKPRGFIFTSINFSLADSIYESSQIFQTSAVGNGQNSISTGFYFVKDWGQWDLNFLVSTSRLFPKSFFDNNQLENIGGSYQANSNLELGISPNLGAFRLGTGFNIFYQSKKKVPLNP